MCISVKTILLLFALPFCLITTHLSAQEVDLDFGKFRKEDLAAKVYEKDSSTSAVILGDYGYCSFTYNDVGGLKFNFTRRTRIKILNSNGYDWANVRIPVYQDGSNQESVSQVKGFTYNLENGKIVKDKLKSDAKFNEKLDEHWEVKSFTMPNVREGSIIEFTYTIVSDFFFNLRPWKFQYEIPVVWSEYMIKIPEYFNYKQIYQGYEPFVLNETFTERGTFTMHSKSRSGFYTTKTEFNNNELAFINYGYRWAAKDVPAMVEEPYMTTIDDYVTKMEFELASTRFPGSTIKSYTRTWENIDEELLKADGFGEILKQNKLVRIEVASLTKDATDPMQKVVSVFNFVKHNYQWNSNHGVFADKSLKQILIDKSGNVADINLLLVLMLKEAGLNANPVILSTRSHGMLRPVYPMLSQFNYVIASVELQGNTYLLDGTDLFSTVDVLPVRCINDKGRIIRENSGDKWVSLEPKAASGNFLMATLSLDEAGALSGTVAASRKYHMAMLERKKIHEKLESNNQEEENLASDPNHWEIRNYEIKGLEELEEPLKENYEVTMNDYYQSAGNLIYLNPIITGRMETNPFKLKTRKFPVDLPYQFNDTYMINFTIPTGYEIDEQPESIAIALPNDGGTYFYTIKQRGNQLQVTSKVNINKRKFVAEEYPYLKEFFDIMVAKNAEQIVLKKN